MDKLMMQTNELWQRLGVTHPLVQAPMAGVATPELAAAVSNAGALGSLGMGSSSPQRMRNLIAATRELTDKPFNINVFCHQPAVADEAREAAWRAYLQPLFAQFDATPPETLAQGYTSFIEDRTQLDVLLQQRPAVVSFIFGLPPAVWVQALRAAGCVTLATVTTLAEAAQAETAGVDAVVAQGMEAGGHRGVFEPRQGDVQLGTCALVRLLASRGQLPVIAAGGIMDGRSIAAMRQLGAAGAQLGTAFILCPESAAQDAHRSALKSSRSEHTSITAVISGRPARGIVNRMHTDVAGANAPELPDYPRAYGAGKALAAAATARGCTDFRAHWAGQGAPLARAMPAAQLVTELVREYQQTLA